MRRSKLLISLLLSFLVCMLAGHARADDSFTVTAVPGSESITGLAGETIGWGYTITNNSTTDYLMTDGVYEDSVLDSVGTVTAIFDFPLLGPMSTVTESYDPTTMTGLIEVTLSSDLPEGGTIIGNVYVQGQFCDSTYTICGNVVTESAAYSITVSPPSGTPVPEPSSMLLFISGLCAIGLCLCFQQNLSGCRKIP